LLIAQSGRTVGTGLRVLLGGGRRWFMPSDQLASSRAATNDYAALPADVLRSWNLSATAAGAADPARDLLSEFQTAGFVYADTASALASAVSEVRHPGRRLPETLDIDRKILFGFGASGDRYETLLTKPRPVIDSLLPSNISSELAAAGYVNTPAKRGSVEGYFVRRQAVGRDQAVHTASDVLISAYAARAATAEQFVGVQRNTDVFVKTMRAALGGY
jgi:alkaline phosphatase